MTKEVPFHKVAIIGVGLIGGSLGLALKKRYPQAHIQGWGRDRARLETAQKMEAIDTFQLNLEDSVKDRDLVILATPVAHILETLEHLGSYLSPGTLVTDVGSTKREICRKARLHLPSAVEFVGGHPVAGREVTGVENSLPNLFKDAPYVLCPQPGVRPENLQRLLRMADGLGARPAVMDAGDHDQIIAWTSHLPQLIATVLANVCQELETPENKLARTSGSGFRDVVRLAGSPYSVWKGILETNDDNIDLALEAFIRQLEKTRTDLKEGRLSYDFDRAVEFFDRYRAARQPPGHAEKTKK